MRGGLCRRRRILGGRMGLVESMAGSSSTAARKRSEWVWSCCCLMGGFLVLLLLLTCIGAVLWLVFRPHSPTLSLQALNITSLTVSCRCHFFSPPFSPSLPLLLLLFVTPIGCFSWNFYSNFNNLCGFSTIQTLRKQIVKSILKGQVWPARCQERNVLLKSNTMMSQTLKLGEAFTGIEFALLSWYENQIPVL